MGNDPLAFLTLGGEASFWGSHLPCFRARPADFPLSVGPEQAEKPSSGPS